MLTHAGAAVRGHSPGLWMVAVGRIHGPRRRPRRHVGSGAVASEDGAGA